MRAVFCRGSVVHALIPLVLGLMLVAPTTAVMATPPQTVPATMSCPSSCPAGTQPTQMAGARFVCFSGMKCGDAIFSCPTNYVSTGIGTCLYQAPTPNPTTAPADGTFVPDTTGGLSCSNGGTAGYFYQNGKPVSACKSSDGSITQNGGTTTATCLGGKCNVDSNFHPEEIINTCWSCSFFAIVFDAAYEIGYHVNRSPLITRLANIIAILMALYLLWIALRLLFPFGAFGGVKQDGNSLVLQMGMVVIALMALKSNNAFYEDYFLTPIIASGVDVGQASLTASLQGVGSIGGDKYKTKIPAQNNGDCDIVQPATTNPASGPASFRLNAPAPPSVMPPKVLNARNKLICQMDSIQKTIGVGALIGVSGIVYGPKVEGLNFNPFDSFGLGKTAQSIIDKLLSIVAGIILLVLYVIAIIVFPFYLLDAFLMVMIIGVLAGFFIFSYSLGIFRKATYAAIRALVEAAAVVTFMSIVVGIGMAMISYASQQYLAAYCAQEASLCNVASKDAVNTLVQQITDGKVWLKLYEPNYWLFILAGFLLLQMMKFSGRLAEIFGTGDAGSGFRDEFNVGVTMGDSAGRQLSNQALLTAIGGTKTIITAPVTAAKAVGGFLERTRSPFGSLSDSELASMGMSRKDANSFEKMKANLEAQAQAGNADAMYKLALIAEKATMSDKTQAYAYQKMAANAGDPRAQAALKRLEKDLSADQIRQGNKMADDWKKTGQLPHFTPPFRG